MAELTCLTIYLKMRLESWREESNDEERPRRLGLRRLSRIKRFWIARVGLALAGLDEASGRPGANAGLRVRRDEICHSSSAERKAPAWVRNHQSPRRKDVRLLHAVGGGRLSDAATARGSRLRAGGRNGGEEGVSRHSGG